MDNNIDLGYYESLCEYYKARCEMLEMMRDHYKTIMTEALHDRDLHATVADVWQQRLICVQKDIMDATEMLGKRLKFSVGHNHIEILVGNPITLFELFNKITVRAYSQCSTKDIYNWKIGVIQAIENFCKQENLSKKKRREIFKAMSKKYPEIFCDNVL